jgi:hypothetical protein
MVFGVFSAAEWTRDCSYLLAQFISSVGKMLDADPGKGTVRGTRYRSTCAAATLCPDIDLRVQNAVYENMWERFRSC